MGGCRCSYKTCKSATKTTENLHFFHYPVKHSERCAIWIKNADKSEFMTLPADQLRNKVICGLHFEDKYFTNVQKKRLVHDAIPTLNEGCDEEVSAVKVEIFPTSVDGSTYTLQADHLQPGPSRNEQKFGFRNGKMIIHKFENTESEVYTIDPNYIAQSFFSKEVFNNPTPFQSEPEPVVFKTFQAEEERPIVFDNHIDSFIANNEEGFIVPNIPNNKNLHNLFFDTEPEIETKKPEVKPEIKFERAVKKRSINKNVLKRINIHAQEIASIKRSLLQSNVKIPKKGIIRMLKGRVPDSLLGAISLHLNKRQNNLTLEEKAFLQAMYSISPGASNVLRDFGWFIPKHIIMDRQMETA